MLNVQWSTPAAALLMSDIKSCVLGSALPGGCLFHHPQEPWQLKLFSIAARAGAMTHLSSSLLLFSVTLFYLFFRVAIPTGGSPGSTQGGMQSPKLTVLRNLVVLLFSWPARCGLPFSSLPLEWANRASNALAVPLFGSLLILLSIVFPQQVVLLAAVALDFGLAYVTHHSLGNQLL